MRQIILGAKGDKVYREDVYCGYIIKGDLAGAICYVKQFPEQAALYQRYISVFDKEQYMSYELDGLLNAVLTAYQRYYRDAFYLRLDQDEAVCLLRARLAALLPVGDENSLDDLEQKIADALKQRGFHFLGGKTGGFYGPYIWKTTQSQTYDVELPSGTQSYTVKFLDGFMAKSWIDYLSFGKIGTGGWTDADGIINCVKDAYDLDSEAFQVSMLKHEAQHARDLALAPNMASAQLEYRAKLVELIYSKERNLLPQFVCEADDSGDGNGHSVASHSIISGYCALLNRNADELALLSVEQIQSVAKELLEKSEGGK